MTGSDQINSIILWNIHIFDVIIGIGFAFFIPIFYSRIQRANRKLRMIKFWDIFIQELDNIPRISAIISPATTLQNILDKLKRIEGLVADLLTEKQFHQYLNMLDHFDELVNDSTVDSTITAVSLKNWLQNLISLNKPPFYGVLTTAKIWRR